MRHSVEDHWNGNLSLLCSELLCSATEQRGLLYMHYLADMTDLPLTLSHTHTTVEKEMVVQQYTTRLNAVRCNIITFLIY